MADEHVKDQELEEYRNLMQVPDTFEDGFSWSSMLGALFIGLVMVPGAMYMGLLAGEGIGPAAQWVTVILFIEVAKRAHRSLQKSELFVLYWMAGAAMGAPFSGLLWNQYFARSDAAVEKGVAADIPVWYAPPPDSVSYDLRTFMHVDWWPVIGLMLFQLFINPLKSMVLGYGLFRIASDIEKLPFPMAPIGAQGIMALAEDSDETNANNAETNWRWRMFSIGGAIGMVWGAVLYLLPTISGALTGTAIQILPLPFVDWTPKTQSLLPAVATGWSWDIANFAIGMVLPFWAMVGSFVGLVITCVANPILYKMEILDSWRTGYGTVETKFANYIDFYFSFGIGVSLAIFIAGIVQVMGSLKKRKKKAKKELEEPSRTIAVKDRGDISWFWVIFTYIATTLSYILVSGWLIDWHRGVMTVLFVLGFVYTPLISYVTARMEGIAGQVVEVPMVKEASMIFSGYVGAKVWFLPLPIGNYGQMTMFYRKCELLGTKFTSIWKAQFFMLPMIIVCSIFFANFIWSLAPVPSGIYPYANLMWELQAEKACVMFSATLGEYSQFEDAWNTTYVGVGVGLGVLLFFVMSKLGAPIFLVYGVVRGLGESMPHDLLPQFIGALIGRFYFKRKFGAAWMKYIPIIAAGVGCGTGLVTVLGIGITFLNKAVIQLPF